MTTIKFSATKTDQAHFSGDLAILFVYQNKNDKPVYLKEGKSFLESLHKLGDFAGKEGELCIFYPEQVDDFKGYVAKRICFIGCGKAEGKNKLTDSLEKYRKIGGQIAKTAKQYKAQKIAVFFKSFEKTSIDDFAQALTEGISLGDYTFTKYKKTSTKDDEFKGITTVKYFAQDNSNKIRKGMQAGGITAIAARDARDMANEPGNKWTPAEFADYARTIAKESGLKCTVFDKKKLQSMKMGGILSVNGGSVVAPKLIILEHEPAKYDQTIMLVGKGLTFDSGGISLKPAAGMQDMKYDMCGGAAVLGAMKAIAAEKPAVRVVGLVPSTDNMISGSATKPGDVITHYGGITSEVINTDAEGRLILADALAYGNKQYKPDCIVDLATLTGAVIICLGHHNTGLVSNNDKLSELLIEAGARTGEPMWRLPLSKDYSKQIESTVADIKNIGGREGGTITAAAYLQKFVDDTPWAHLDIAGTAWNFTEKSYVPKGPSGIGVRTLIDFVKNWKKTKL